MFSLHFSRRGDSTRLRSRTAKPECRRRSRRGQSQRSYGTCSRVHRSAAPTQRRSWVSTRSKPLALTIFSRECILRIENGSRPPCAVSSPNTLHIPATAASSTPTAGKSGSRKRQRANLIPWGAWYASKASLSTSPRASSPRISRVYSSPLWMIVSRICWRVSPLSPRICAKGTVCPMQTFKHSIGASMAGVYTLISRNRWKGVDLAELVRCQLAPSASDVNATIWGPAVTLTAPATQALAMVLHELVTNAAKYGGLSTSHRRVEGNWHRRTPHDAAHPSLLLPGNRRP